MCISISALKLQVRRHLAQGLGSHILLDPLYGKGSRGRKKNGRSDDEWTDEAIVDHVSGIATGGLESPPKSKKSNAASALARSGVFFLHAQSLRLPHPVVRG
jgi:23S rRNA-/tRNA-specific pseudouridylate synthase